jgi:hypothetical protein
MFGAKVMLRVSAFVKRLFNCVSSLRKGRKNWVHLLHAAIPHLSQQDFNSQLHMFITHQSPGE